MNINLDVPVICAVCRQSISYRLPVAPSGLAIEVDPCTTCLASTYEDGVNDTKFQKPIDF